MRAITPDLNHSHMATTGSSRPEYCTATQQQAHIGHYSATELRTGAQHWMRCMASNCSAHKHRSLTRTCLANSHA